MPSGNGPPAAGSGPPDKGSVEIAGPALANRPSLSERPAHFPGHSLSAGGPYLEREADVHGAAVRELEAGENLAGYDAAAAAEVGTSRASRAQWRRRSRLVPYAVGRGVFHMMSLEDAVLFAGDGSKTGEEKANLASAGEKSWGRYEGAIRRG